MYLYPKIWIYRLICSADRCQLLLSDNEGQVLQLANRLVNRGARTLHLHLPSIPSSYHPVFRLMIMIFLDNAAGIVRADILVLLLNTSPQVSLCNQTSYLVTSWRHLNILLYLVNLVHSGRARIDFLKLYCVILNIKIISYTQNIFNSITLQILAKTGS